MEKFNFQLVIKKSDDCRVIYTGVTSKDVRSLLLDVLVESNSTEVQVESLVYQPVNLEKGDTK